MVFALEEGINEPINLGSGEGVSIKKLVKLIIENMENKPDIIWDTSKPTGDRKRLLNVDKAKSYGFNLTVSIEQGISRTFNWYKENKNIVHKRYNVFKEGIKDK